MTMSAKFVKQLQIDILVNLENLNPQDPSTLPPNAIGVQSIDVFVRVHSA